MAILSVGELLGIGPSELSGKVSYTDLGGSGGVISSISGSALSAGLPSATVSAIASSYALSAASSKVDQSAFDNCCSSMSSYVSAIQQDTANISAAVSGITGGGGGGAVYHDATLTGSGLSSSPLGVNNMELVFDSASLSQTVTGSSATVSVRYPISLISASSDATAQDVIYIVTGVS